MQFVESFLKPALPFKLNSGILDIEDPWNREYSGELVQIRLEIENKNEKKVIHRDCMGGI